MCAYYIVKTHINPYLIGSEEKIQFFLFFVLTIYELGSIIKLSNDYFAFLTTMKTLAHQLHALRHDLLDRDVLRVFDFGDEMPRVKRL